VIVVLKIRLLLQKVLSNKIFYIMKTYSFENLKFGKNPENLYYVFTAFNPLFLHLKNMIWVIS